MIPQRWIVTAAGIAPFCGVPTKFLLGGVWRDMRIGGERGVARLARHGVVLEKMLDVEPAPEKTKKGGRLARKKSE